MSMTVKVPPDIHREALEIASAQFLKPSEVVRSWMRKGRFADQMERGLSNAPQFLAGAKPRA